jgi:hypothetical protein
MGKRKKRVIFKTEKQTNCNDLNDVLTHGRTKNTKSERNEVNDSNYIHTQWKEKKQKASNKQREKNQQR